MYVWGEMCDSDICYTKPNFLKYNNKKKRKKKLCWDRMLLMIYSLINLWGEMCFL